MDIQAIGVLAALPILIASAISDLRHLRIPNRHVMYVLVVFAVLLPFLPTWSELGFRIAAGSAAFAIGFALFALRMFGGGDVKMMAAVFLVIPSADQLVFLQLFSASLLATSIGIVMLQRMPSGVRPEWQSARLQRHVPVGVAIAGGAGLLSICRVIIG